MSSLAYSSFCSPSKLTNAYDVPHGLVFRKRIAENRSGEEADDYAYAIRSLMSPSLPRVVVPAVASAAAALASGAKRHLFVLRELAG